MPEFLVRLLISICIIWLVQLVLGTLGVKEPANRTLFIITLVVCIIFIVLGFVPGTPMLGPR